MTYLGFGSALIAVAFGLACATVLAALLGAGLRDRRFVAAARNAMAAGGLAAAGAAVTLVAGFLRGAYDVNYIYNYSERKLPWAKKVAGLWAGLDGSILFWAAILGLIGTVLAFGFAKRSVAAEKRRMEPWVLAVFAAVQCFFLGVILFVKNPFDPVPAEHIRSLTARGLAVGGMPTDGAGLNPLLDTYWMMVHPPSVYLGFILYTVPFAYGAAALLSGEMSSAWIKATRGWTMAAWVFNTNGIVLGGLWAYEVLGWGGYWAWDPVENASFLPWLTGTAFLHSVMVQERRGMFRGWNAFLVCATFVLSIFGTYLTRSGVVSSVHAFSNGDVGRVFLGFLVALIAFSAFLIALRWRSLRNDDDISHLASREAVFVLNNLVLVALAVVITLLVLWPKLSVEFTGRAVTLGPPTYNRICTPLFLGLFVMTAIGPSLGWVRTTAAQAARNLVVPAIAALPASLVLCWFAWTHVRGGAQGESFDPVSHVYPVGLLAYFACLSIATVAWEVLRTARNSGAASGRGTLGALSRMLSMQNRRYGGYVVHTGLAMIGIAIVISSVYPTKTEVAMAKGVRTAVSEDKRWEIELLDVTRTPPQKGQAHLSIRTRVRVTHDGAETAVLEPEMRVYEAVGHRREPTVTSEVAVARLPLQDFYIHFEKDTGLIDETPGEGPASGQVHFNVYRNPYMWLLWAGWMTMIVGGVYAALPLGGRKVGLAG
ncbi:MAG: Cytochrome c-type biogenesis protein CcmF [Planctomycetes bacterium]|nr:Cytochrome c-type biogenesis protein CcmF [Planctomycetota bacterium]